MVVVQCYHCSKILELDEGFRGGVCRCSQCGSLLQVPKAATTGAVKARPAAPGARTETRPASPTSDPGLSRGQFDPRSGIGSGLAASGARPQRPDTSIGTGAFAGSGGFAPSPQVPAPRKIEKVAPLDPPPGMPTAATHARQARQGRTILILSLAVIVVLIGGGTWAIIKLVDTMRVPGGKAGSSTLSQAATEGARIRTPIVESEAHVPVGFYGVKLTGRKIVISVDSGGSMRDVYDHIRKSFDEALRQLDDTQQVRVVIWQSPPIVVPADGWARKSERARFKAFEDSYASPSGQDVTSNMVESLKLGADQTIFVTAKIDFPMSLVETIAKERKGDQRVDTIWVSSSEEEPPLKKIAESSGGTHTTMTASDVVGYYR